MIGYIKRHIEKRKRRKYISKNKVLSVSEFFHDKHDWKFIDYIDDKILLEYRDNGVEARLYTIVSFSDRGYPDFSSLSYIIYDGLNYEFNEKTDVNMSYAIDYYLKNDIFYCIYILNTNYVGETHHIFEDIILKIKNKFKDKIKVVYNHDHFYAISFKDHKCLPLTF